MKKILYASILSLALATAAPVAEAVTVPDVEAMSRVDISSAPGVKTVEEGVELSASASESTTFMIYSITGQLVKKVVVSASTHETVSLPGGCYVVRCQAWAKKIVVR